MKYCLVFLVACFLADALAATAMDAHNTLLACSKKCEGLRTRNHCLQECKRTFAQMPEKQQEARQPVRVNVVKQDTSYSPRNLIPLIKGRNPKQLLRKIKELGLAQ